MRLSAELQKISEKSVDFPQKSAKIGIMLHEITSLSFLIFAMATPLALALAEKPRTRFFSNIAICTFGLTIASVVGAFFTI